MKQFLQGMGLSALAVLLMGASGLFKAEIGYAVKIVTADELVPVWANDPATADPVFKRYHEVCIKVMDTDSTQKVFISTFSTINDTLYGWPLVGTEKECHDWDQAVPLYVWRETAGADREVRFLFVR